MPEVFLNKHLTAGGDDPLLPVLLEAINKADDIALAIAFVRSTGLRLMYQALEDALARGAKLRFLTGDYLEVTEPKALKLLMLLKEQGADVKVYESSNTTSFHMKVFIFTRTQSDAARSGCAFVGSSNISRAALVDGLEWNLKVELQEDHDRFVLIQQKYESLYALPQCCELTHQWINRYSKRVAQRDITRVPTQPGEDEVELPPEPNSVQIDALKALEESRAAGYQRGLVVLATGLGKTWLAAFDSQQLGAKKLLFIGHREEILAQAEATFVRVRPDATIGKYTGTEKQPDVDMLFASVQTLGTSNHLSLFAPNHFDYVVVDEFHHAAARTYQRLLSHFNPRFLLGLTATPERTDQSDILALCDDNLVVNKDLFYGIETDLLCPFNYYGIADEVNYQEISWRNGRFDPNQLENQLATHARARSNFREWKDKHQSRTLAFCISKKHADFMADYFERQGVRAASVHSESSMRRSEALELLKDGKLDVIFSVDLFNEGVDLPAIDTVLMLRPTESKIVFLQQLGRGLRRSEATGKERLTVLDFIGNHVSFFRKPEALFKIGVTTQARKAFLEKLQSDTLPLPRGCFVNYDLQSIEFMSQLIATKGDLQVEVYRNLRESLGRRPTLAEFYNVGGAVETIRKDYGSWFALVGSENDLSHEEGRCVDAYGEFFIEVEKTNLTKSFKLVLLEAFIELEGFTTPPDITTLAGKSFEILRRRPVLKTDLPEQFQGLQSLDSDALSNWTGYWGKNPVNAWIGGNTQKASLFLMEGNTLAFVKTVRSEEMDSFAVLTQELVNYRFLQYESRLEQHSVVEPAPARSESTSMVPLFSDFKIACGHFRHSPHESSNISFVPVPTHLGPVDVATHFTAQANGNSMDGGDDPIKSGDYLLFRLVDGGLDASPQGVREAVLSEYASSTAAFLVENRSGTADEFLLRDVSAASEGTSTLIARNSAYPPIRVSDEASLVARLISKLDPLDLKVHQDFMREDIPPLFGLEFNPGVWNSGHICPTTMPDQILLVTLNKQGKIAEQQYHDYFIDSQTFHWQSQNSTAPTGKKGKAIIFHETNGSSVHLFVRKNKLRNGKAAPFTYCGRVDYSDHKSEKPMNVTWRLHVPLSESLFRSFSLAK